MSSNSFHTFPKDYAEALAILYLQNQDLRGKSPSEIHTMFQNARYEILKDHREKTTSGWFNTVRESD